MQGVSDGFLPSPFRWAENRSYYLRLGNGTPIPLRPSFQEPQAFTSHEQAQAVYLSTSLLARRGNVDSRRLHPGVAQHLGENVEVTVPAVVDEGKQVAQVMRVGLAWQYASYPR